MSHIDFALEISDKEFFVLLIDLHQRFAIGKFCEEKSIQTSSSVSNLSMANEINSRYNLYEKYENICLENY